jgi:ribonucleoside-diphosphate reductase beta chain
MNQMNNEYYVIKRSGDKETFQANKIKNAIINAYKNCSVENQISAVPNFFGTIENTSEIIANGIFSHLFPNSSSHIENEPTVDEIHDIVEMKLMDLGLNHIAKEYILYRSKTKTSLFKKRLSLKPYEYPSLVEYVDAIRHSYWIHTEFNFTSDIQDFKVHLSDKEKTAVQRAMLAISQIEIAVKTFWGDIYKKMPKPEIGAVGATFAESEVRHADAYSHLIQILGLNSEFENLLEVPAIRKRIKYLEKAISNTKSIENQDYFESIILFSMFIENVSLFSQFLVIMSFNKHKNVLKGISNAVEATSKEEDIHAKFGFDLINLIKSENPEWWTQDLIDDIIDSAKIAYEAEADIINWIFELGDLDFLTKSHALEFIKDRFNRSLNAIGIKEVFEINKSELNATEWFDDEILTTKHTDFFNKRSINYSKKQKSITLEDLF